MARGFDKLCETFEKLENTRSGNQMRSTLSDLFKNSPNKDIGTISYLCLGRITSKYDDIDLGIATKMIQRALEEWSGKDTKQLYKEKGDLGLVAQQLVRNKKKKSTLTVQEVHKTLQKIAQTRGSGSQQRKLDLFKRLLDKSTPQEAKYLTRLALGTLRLGVGEQTLLDALAKAYTGTKENKKVIEHAYNVCPDSALIATTLANKGLKGLKTIRPQIGRPIQMMLAQRVKSLEELEKNMPGKRALEEKYDGLRVQIHKKNTNITLFSRRLENITTQFPDIATTAKRALKARNCIVEGEIVPIGKKDRILPFQNLMERRRKHNVDEYTKSVPVRCYLFDCLHTSKSLLHKPYPERYQQLKKILGRSTTLQLADQIRSDKLSDLKKFFKKAIRHGGEGIIAKNLSKHSTYRAGARAWMWIKWKREYAKELQDTFDLVIIGAFKGRGKRAGSYGSILCAAYNKKKDRFESVCKVGSGFTDKHLKELPEKLKKLERKNKHPRVTTGMRPDVWLTPSKVVEVLAGEVTRSPLHAAAKEKSGKGLSLRFPRFLRYRDDRKPEQATSVDEIKTLAK